MDRSNQVAAWASQRWIDVVEIQRHGYRGSETVPGRLAGAVEDPKYNITDETLTPESTDYGIIDALTTYLNGSSDQRATALRLFALVQAAPDTREAYYAVIHGIFDAILEINDSDTPSQAADLVSALSALADAVNNTDKIIQGFGQDLVQPGEIMVMYKSAGVRIWHDLPDFGMAMREFWNGPLSFPDHLSIDQIRRRWVSLNSFSAHLFKRHRDRHPLFRNGDWLLLWTISTALGKRNRAKHPREGYNELMDTYVSAAGRIIEILGDTLMEDWTVSQRVGGPLWHGGYGFSLPRWLFWRSRFEVLAAAESSSTMVRQASGEALLAMEHIWESRIRRARN